MAITLTKKQKAWLTILLTVTWPFWILPALISSLFIFGTYAMYVLISDSINQIKEP